MGVLGFLKVLATDSNNSKIGEIPCKLNLIKFNNHQYDDTFLLLQI